MTNTQISALVLASSLRGGGRVSTKTHSLPTLRALAKRGLLVHTGCTTGNYGCGIRGVHQYTITEEGRAIADAEVSAVLATL